MTSNEGPKSNVTLLLRGPFSREDVIAILKLVRYIDGQKPTGDFLVQIDDPTEAIADAEGVLREALPPDENRNTEIVVLRKQ